MRAIYLTLKLIAQLICLPFFILIGAIWAFVLTVIEILVLTLMVIFMLIAGLVHRVADFVYR